MNCALVRDILRSRATVFQGLECEVLLKKFLKSIFNYFPRSQVLGNSLFYSHVFDLLHFPISPLFPVQQYLIDFSYCLLWLIVHHFPKPTGAHDYIVFFVPDGDGFDIWKDKYWLLVYLSVRYGFKSLFPKAATYRTPPEYFLWIIYTLRIGIDNLIVFTHMVAAISGSRPFYSFT